MALPTHNSAVDSTIAHAYTVGAYCWQAGQSPGYNHVERSQPSGTCHSGTGTVDRSAHAQVGPTLPFQEDPPMAAAWRHTLVPG